MSGVLDELLRSARERAARLAPPTSVAGRSGRAGAPWALAAALRGRDAISVIAEVKRSSPSHGAIAPAADAVAQARAYADAGAAAISVLTEPTRFGGSLADLERVAGAVDVPVLMKDFVVAPAQVRCALDAGASAVLLIVRALEGAQLGELLAACREHGLEALVECHDADECARAVAVGAGVIGVNNRDLDTLAVDLERAPRLLAGLPADAVAVAESGYRSARDLDGVRGGVDAVLVGSALMRAADPRRAVEELLR